MININEIKNTKVVYDGKDGELTIPLSYSAIKEKAPWIEEEQNGWIRNNIKGMTWGFPYIYTSPENKSYILVDTKSKQPTLYGGTYNTYGSSDGDRQIPTHGVFAHRPELSKILKLRFNMKHRIRYKMPFTDEEMKEYSKTNSFADAVYKITHSKTGPPISHLDETYLHDFLTDDVTGTEYKYPNTLLADDEEEVYFGDNGIIIFTPVQLYKENYLDIDMDDDWAFDTAFYEYNDCEEMETDELQYIDNYMTPKTQNRFRDFVNKFEPTFWKDEDVNPDRIDDEGVFDSFFQNYFSREWESDNWEILEAIGCSVWRARQRQTKEEIDDEAVYQMDYYNSHYMSTYISYPQLLHLIHFYNIKDFGEIRNHEINSIGSNLQDVWYDAWEIDEEGIKDLNYAMMSIMDKLEKKYSDSYDEAKKNISEFSKILKDLGIKKHSWWGRGDIFVKDLLRPGNTNVGRETKYIQVSNFKPVENTVDYVFYDEGEKVKKQEMKVSDLGTEVSNLKIDFPEDKVENE